MREREVTGRACSGTTPGALWSKGESPDRWEHNEKIKLLDAIKDNTDLMSQGTNADESEGVCGKHHGLGRRG